MLNLSTVSVYTSAYAIFRICKIEGKQSTPELEDEDRVRELGNQEVIVEVVGSRGRAEAGNGDGGICSPVEGVLGGEEESVEAVEGLTGLCRPK